MTTQVSTRERLLREGLRLFASQGFAATTVGEIEEAAGLQPRRGALYRHFPSKEALLEAAAARLADTVDHGAIEFTDVPLDDPYGLALLVGRWILDNLDAEREMTQILEREGDRLVAIRNQFRKASDASFRAASEALRNWAKVTGQDVDTDAFAVVLIGGLVNYRRSTWTLGRSPLAIKDERFLKGFADIFATLFSQ
jgi:AcrR family transcriptional regulator